MNIKDILPFKTLRKSKSEPLQPAKRKLADAVIARNKSIIRRDITDWIKARQEASRADFPRRKLLSDLYDEIMIDSKVTSKIQQRKLLSTGSEWSIIDNDGNIVEDITKDLRDSIGFAELMELILDTPYFGHSLVEISIEKTEISDKEITVKLIPRANVIPQIGLFLPDANGTKGIEYKKLAEFNTTIFEFGKPDNLGLLNKAVPSALYKRFAQSCWSELCEIYGIPPRYMKTDTTDPNNLDRAEQMMRDMGANPWWIIDTTEDFGFVNAVTTNGDLYDNLIKACNNEITTLICGAVIGEDSPNGSRSKEEVGQSMLNDLAAADRVYVGKVMNTRIMPALAKLGIIPEGLRFKFSADEDIKALWQRVVQALPYYRFDIEWLNTIFGLSITEERAAGIVMNNQEMHHKEKTDPFL